MARTDIPDPQIILDQVKKICQSEHFISKEVLCRFLSFIVKEKLDAHEDSIKAYTIALEVFHRDPGFDAGQDALVRINAGRLRRMLELYYLTTGKDDEIVIKIPKGGYVPHFSIAR